MTDFIVIDPNKEVDFPQVSRVEVIDENGRSYTNWNKNNVITLSFQDDMRTLKIFISKLNK